MQNDVNEKMPVSIQLNTCRVQIIALKNTFRISGTT
jgi:hypothetical protein